jgi:hypothetical protein
MAALKITSLLLVIGIAPCFAEIFYSQPATFPGGNASQFCTGCFGNSGIDFTSFDDFTLTANEPVVDVLWQSSYSDAGNHVTAFNVSFWQNAGGLPGTLLQSYNIAGNANETFVTTGLNGYLEYKYSAALSTPFAAAAGTTYWLSIQPALVFPPQWYWRAASGGDGVSAFQDPNISPTPELIPQDLAFSLSNSQLPEPTVTGLTALLFSLLLIVRWRRRRIGN